VKRNEMIQILETIARKPDNPNARVSALRLLRKFAAEELEPEAEQTAFDDLDKDMKRQEWQKRRWK
jgi:hypothetical protein